ncbi:MAG: SPOR domain-containing protein [Flavobacteriales bacterium]|nr:SPOR domain-containing protein [Flavobacteriales bacterium]
MKSFIPKVLLVLCCLLAYTNASGQATIDQNEMFPQLLNEKRTQNQILSFQDVYTIQIFSGNYADANKTIEESRLEYQDLDQSLEFNTPSYKIWVGCFENRIDAARNLKRLLEKYPSAFIIKLK